ncbi:hypothetical protein GCM10009712_42920 [Pseudarthrobacter sulfonivorans]
MELVSEIAGWSGAASILAAYLLVSMGWLRAGRRFQAANLAGACAFVINGAHNGAWPSVVTNIVWFLISLVSLVRIARKKTAAEPGKGPSREEPAATSGRQHKAS